jgi:glycogen debranching enzyme
MNLIEEARVRAHDVLDRCATAAGLKASALPAGYPQVWARDGGISALGAMLLDDTTLPAAVKNTLGTLADAQSELGLIPLNVHPDSGEVSGENAGALDSNMWFIVAHYVHHAATQDAAYLHDAFPRLERAFLWLRYQDMNECGLLEVPEAGNWADLLAVRYNTLYDNVLYAAAHAAMAAMATALGRDASAYCDGARGTIARIRAYMWVDRGWDADRFAQHLDHLKRLRLEWYMAHYNAGVISSRPYFLPYIAFREYGDFFDSFGNLLAIILGIADADRTARILDYVHAAGVDAPYPLKAFFPPILPGDRDWREYYRSRNLNLPNQYHNGGIWPFLGGLYIAALVRAGRTSSAEEALGLLASANSLGREGRWEFNEWLHGVTGRPMGHPLQAWSAALYIFAYEALDRGAVPFLGELSVDA